jgi:hypothetical protein
MHECKFEDAIEQIGKDLADLPAQTSASHDAGLNRCLK